MPQPRESRLIRGLIMWNDAVNYLGSRLLQSVHRLHYRRPVPWAWFLLALFPTLMYHMAFSIRHWAYQIRLKKVVYLPVPVISVGNLSTGGTGKTPLVIALATYLHETLGLRVGILNRGYGAKSPQAYAHASHPDYGDEAFEMQQACPFATVIVGRKRAHNAQRLLKETPLDILILDDGLQYLPLARDYNIALIDDSTRLGNERLLPMGPLREPLGGLKRCDMVLVTRPQEDLASLRYANQLVSRLRAYRAISGFIHAEGFCARPWLEAVTPNASQAVSHLPVAPMGALAFTGIGHPEQFKESLCRMGLHIRGFYALPDHAPLEGRWLEKIMAHWELLQKPPVYCTQKDAVKLSRDGLPDEFAKAIQVVFMAFQLPDALKQALKRFTPGGGREEDRAPSTSSAEQAALSPVVSLRTSSFHAL
jgi:tetraacyldisaccharide 4'-kinase